MTRVRIPACVHCGCRADRERPCCPHPYLNVRDPELREQARLAYPGRAATPPADPGEKATP